MKGKGKGDPKARGNKRKVRTAFSNNTVLISFFQNNDEAGSSKKKTKAKK